MNTCTSTMLLFCVQVLFTNIFTKNKNLLSIYDIILNCMKNKRCIQNIHKKDWRLNTYKYTEHWTMLKKTFANEMNLEIIYQKND